MANFFGFLTNYSKEGPGVSKNVAEKKRFFLFFELVFRKLGKLITLNLIYILFCIPIITIGPATAALTYVLRNFAREEHAFIWMDFVDAFRSNFKQSFVVFLVDIVVGILLYMSFNFYSLNISLSDNNILFYIALGLIFLFILMYIFMRYYIYTVLVSIELNIVNVYKNSFILAILGFLKNFMLTIIIGGLLFGIIAMSYYLQPYGLLAAILLVPVILLSFLNFIIVFTTYPTFDRYLLQPSIRMSQGKDPFDKAEDEPNDDNNGSIFSDTV